MEFINICSQRTILMRRHDFLTHPRRKHFVRLHTLMHTAASFPIIIFISAVLSHLLSGKHASPPEEVPRYSFPENRNRQINALGMDAMDARDLEEETMYGFPENRDRQTNALDMDAREMDAVIAGCIILPSAIGIIVAAVLNGHSYLVLGQSPGCYASYVSARFGYIDLYFVEWPIKLATWIGLNTEFQVIIDVTDKF
jgi:hypothetical protein